MSSLNKALFEDQLLSNSPDLNKEALVDVIKNYTGVRFWYDFWYLSDFFPLFIIVIFLWVGVFLSNQIQSQKEAGYGNLVITRKPYKRYFVDILAAQSLYIVTVLSVVFVLLFSLAMVWGGTYFNKLEVGIYDFGLGGVGIGLIIQIVQLLLLTIFVNILSQSCNIWIKNKYLLQGVPIILFALLPMVLGSTIANFSSSIGGFIKLFIPFATLLSLDSICQYEVTFGIVFNAALPYIIYMGIAILLSCLNVKKNSENYL